MPIGLSLPLRDGNSGYFEQTNDTFSTYKNNLINLINTIPNERRFSSFGSRLWTTVFEPISDITEIQIKNIITEDISHWIGGIKVDSVIINSNELTDNNTLNINITFTVMSVNQQDSINLKFQPSI